VKDVKRKNLMKLFIEGNEIDKYISTHLFGEILKVNDNHETVNESHILDISVSTLSKKRSDQTLLKN
jgi:hypothetical protein